MSRFRSTLALVPFLALALTLDVSLEARASDAPFASDTLPVLIAEAKVIVRTTPNDAGFLSNSSRAVLFSVKAREVLRGEVDLERPLQVVLTPSPRDGFRKESLNDALLFLRAPLSRAALDRLGLNADGPVYALAYGENGRIAAGKERIAAVKQYPVRSAAFPADRLEGLAWAERFVKSEDEFLRRSALFENLRYARDDSDSRVVALCNTVLDSQAFDPGDKEIAIQTLRETKRYGAVQVLSDYAQDRTTPLGSRVSALEAMATLPKGRDELSRLTKEGVAPIVAPAAQRVLESVRRAAKQDSAPMPSAGEVKEISTLLSAKNLTERLKGLDQAANFGFSDELFNTMKARLAEPKAGIAEKQRVIDVVSKVGRNRPEVAEFLKTVVTDRKSVEDIRSSAIFGLGKMETGISAGALKDLTALLLADTPEDARLRGLVRMERAP